MRINVLFFILLSLIGLTSMGWADEPQKQVNSANVVAESEKMSLHKRCEEDPDWCEKRDDKKNLDDENCLENFTCEKTQDIQVVKQTPQPVEEKWCADNPEICEQLKANTEKLRDLQEQVDELRQTLSSSQKTNDQHIEESPTVETPAVDQ